MKTHNHQEPNIPKKIEAHHLIKNIKQKKHESRIAHYHILFEMIIKHYKLLFQSKISLATMILGPLLMILLIGAAFNTSGTHGLKLSTYSQNYSNISERMITSLSKDFNIIRAKTISDCKDEIQRGTAQACIEFPPGLDPEVESKNNEITIYADFSQINLVYIILSKLNEGVGIRSEELSEKYAQELLNVIRLTSKETKNNQKIIIEAKESLEKTAEGLDNANYLLLKAPTNFTIENINGLSNTISNLESETTSLSTSIHEVMNLASLLESDKKATNKELEEAESQYETDCLNGTRASDCDEQELYIDYLKFFLQSITNYQSRINSDLLDQQIIQIQLGIGTLKPTANYLKLKLEEAKQKMNNNSIIISNASKELKKSFSGTKNTYEKIMLVEESMKKITNSISSLKITNAKSVAKPVKTRIEKISTGKTHINNLFPSLLSLFIMLISILLSSTFIIIEKKSSAFIRNNIAPVYSYLFPLSSLIVLLSIILLETIIMVLIAQFLFSIKIITISTTLLLTTIISSSIYIFLGMAIGFFFDNEESISLASILISSVMMLFSSLIFPIQNMSRAMSQITSFNPFVISSEILRKLIIFKARSEVVANSFYSLTIILLAMIILFMISYKITIRRT